MSNSTVPINEWPMQRIAAGIFVTIWGMVSRDKSWILEVHTV